MKDATLVKRLKFAYASAVIMIIILITISQGLVQYTLYRSVETRTLASTMALQELRTQAAFRNALLSVLPVAGQKEFDVLNTDPVQALQTNLSQVEATNAILIGPTTPPEIAAPIKALQSDYTQMDQAAHLVLASLSKGDQKQAGTQVGVMFIHEQRYLTGMFNAYTLLTSEADDYVSLVRMLEFAIFLASLFVLALEAFIVVRPAINDYNAVLMQIEQQQHDKETTK